MLKGILAAKVLAPPPSSPLAAFRHNKNQLWSLRTCIDKNLGNVAFSKLHVPILNIFNKMNLNRKIKSFSQKNLAVHHVCSNFDALDEIFCESLMCDSYYMSSIFTAFIATSIWSVELFFKDFGQTNFSNNNHTIT